MLERLMKLYVMAMTHDVRSPTPHMFGPPGCGKSSTAEQLAQMLGVNLHIINVARLSPLEVEGLQMPVDDNTRVHLIPAAFWSRLKEGDIVLFDEFLRGFPEVYNALLDIFTSRRAGNFVLPKVFFLAASNSTVSYDKALEDRLLHLPVDDPRERTGTGGRARKTIAKLIVEQLGLLPEMVKSMEMESLIDTEIAPMFSVLDSLGKGGTSPAVLSGHSVRNLIGQALLREVQSAQLKALILENNRLAMRDGKLQYVTLIDGKNSVPPDYEVKARKLKGNPRLTKLQSDNLDLNLQLIELERIRNSQEGTTTDDDPFLTDLD